MELDLKKALSLGPIRKIADRQKDVVTRFGPLFRDPSKLTADEYLAFLDIKHNGHWSNLHRLGKNAANNIENLRRVISILVDETRPLAERYDEADTGVKGLGKGTFSAILLVAYPDRYGVWNGTSEPKMVEAGVMPDLTECKTDGERYELINAALIEKAAQLGTDLWTLDAIWWHEKLDAKKVGRHLDEWEKAASIMAVDILNTTQQSNGQAVERTVKNKECDMQRPELEALLVELMEETDGCCAITGLKLEPGGPDLNMRPSPDRIDSSAHYTRGNIQVTARFINYWKQATDNKEFVDLIMRVRHG